MKIPGFVNPATNTMTLERAVPFHADMDRLLGEYSAVGERMLWFVSVLCGILVCKFMYETSKALSPVVFPGYNKLKKTEKLEWNARSFSTAHALISSVIAFYLLYISDLFRDSAPYGPIIFRSSILSQFGLGFSCGYFIADMAALIAFYPILGGYEFAIHHLVSTMALILAVHCGHAHFYMYIVLFSECTTPFINLRWYLTVLGLKDTDAYTYNGAFTALLWLIVRVINFLYCYHHLYTHFDEAKQLHTLGLTLLLLAPTSLGVMNFYWYYKIMNTVYRTLSQKRAP